MIAQLFEPRTIRKLLLLFLVAGMASFSRRFAYFGLSESTGLPIYVTEIVLAASVYLGFLGCCTSANLRDRLKGSINSTLAAYWLWGLILLAVALPVYGFDALRDFVVVYYSLFIFVAIAALRTIEDVRQLLYVIVAANLVFVVTVLLRVAQGDFNVSGIYLRLGGGSQGLYSVIAFIVVLVSYLVSSRQNRRSRWLLLLLPLFLVGILGPQHRTLILTFAGALAVLFLTLPRWGKPRLVSALAIALVCTAVLLVVVPNGIAAVSGQLPKYLRFFDLHEGSIAARLTNYRRALDDIAASPVWGVGFGTPRFFDYGNPDLLAPVRAPHNSYLGIAYRSGIVGLTLFLILLLGFYVHALQRIVTITDERLRGYGAAILAAHAAVAIMALFNVTLEGPHEGIIFWILIGAELRVLQLAEAPSETPILTGWQPAVPGFAKSHPARSAAAVAQRGKMEGGGQGVPR